MLKTKKPEVDTIMTFKLTTGEEIIGEYQGSHLENYLVKRPLSLIMAEMPGSPHQTQVVFTPWMLALADDEVARIKRDCVIAKAPARKDAADQYTAATRP